MLDISGYICNILKKLGYPYEKFDAASPFEDAEGATITPPPLEFIKTYLGKSRCVYIYGEIVDTDAWEEITSLMKEYPYDEIDYGNIIFIFQEDEEELPTEDFNLKIKVSNLEEELGRILKNISSLTMEIVYAVSTKMIKEVRVRVTDEENNPIPDATIFVRHPQYILLWENVGKTDKNGEKIIEIKKPHKLYMYRIKARKIGYLSSPDIII